MTTENKKEFPLLVGDVGGTNARFGLVWDSSGKPRSIRVYPCAEFPGLRDAITAYLSEFDGIRPRRAALAVATAVTGDQVRMTNHVWHFSIEETRKALGLERLLVLNDFTALAMALPRLREDELKKVGGGEAVADRPLALLGPGTGLGVSGLIPAKEGWIPLEGEGGHASFSPVTERETEILRILFRRFSHVSAERVLSGPGLVNLYQAHAVLEGVKALPCLPEEITNRGMEGSCMLCSAALESFCAILGTTAANLTLTLGAQGGLYIGGGIVPRLMGYFESSPFRPRFEEKGRFSSYLASIPSFVIVAKYPALYGAAAFLLEEG